MKKFEFKSVKMNNPNGKSDDGWELVSALHDIDNAGKKTGRYILFFKREILEEVPSEGKEDNGKLY